MFPSVGAHGLPIPAPLTVFRQCVVKGKAETLDLGEELAQEPWVVPGSVEIEGPLRRNCGGELQNIPRHRKGQLHLESGEKGGLDFTHAWSFAGGTGDRVTVVDVECGWHLDHHRLTRRPRELISAVGPVSGRNHGTAVLGLLYASGTKRVRGLVTGAEIQVAQTVDLDPDFNVFNVLAHVALLISPPAVILVERQLSKLRLVDRRHLRHLPPESWRAGRAAVRVADERGIHVVMCAGNGGLRLDEQGSSQTPDADHLPPPPRGDSGAILVGARDSIGGRRVLPTSNRGDRVNVSAQGRWVATLRRANPGDREILYSFGETSSAGAIVAGAVASLCGILEANRLADQYGPRDVRELLVATGRNPLDGIGAQPDLRRAIVTLMERHGPLRRVPLFKRLRSRLAGLFGR